MTLVVFVRGVNVGGHKTFRPSVLAKELRTYGVTSIGAAGTFVVRKPGSRAKFRAALLRKLPFEAEIAICNAADIARVVKKHPFEEDPPAGVVRFVSILPKAIPRVAAIPVAVPSESEWLVRLIASRGQFVFGVYRRHMKTIGYLGRMDRLVGARGTVRNWNTILAVARALES